MISNNIWLNENSKISSVIKLVCKATKSKIECISNKIKEDWARGDKINIALKEAKNEMHTKPHLFMLYK